MDPDPSVKGTDPGDPDPDPNQNVMDPQHRILTQDGDAEDPEEEPVQHHGHVLPVLLHLQIDVLWDESYIYFLYMYMYTVQ